MTRSGCTSTPKSRAWLGGGVPFEEIHRRARAGGGTSPLSSRTSICPSCGDPTAPARHLAGHNSGGLGVSLARERHAHRKSERTGRADRQRDWGPSTSIAPAAADAGPDPQSIYADWSGFRDWKANSINVPDHPDAAQYDTHDLCVLSHTQRRSSASA